MKFKPSNCEAKDSKVVTNDLITGIDTKNTIEKLIADKCIATLSERRFRRAKDFYELYVLINSGINYNLEEVVKCMRLQFDDDAITHLLTNFPFSEDIVLNMDKTWDSLKLTTYNGESIPSLNTIIRRLTILYDNLKIKMNIHIKLTYDSLVEFLKTLDKQDYILVGDIAFIFQGHSVNMYDYPNLLTAKSKIYWNLQGVVSYVPTEDLRTNLGCELIEGTTVYMSSSERNIVECIRNEMLFIAEGSFCDALERYSSYGCFNYKELIRVANELNVATSVIDYWLDEVKDFNSH